MKNMKKKIFMLWLLLLVVTLVGTIFGLIYRDYNQRAILESTKNIDVGKLKLISLDELKNYNGDDLSKPIYIGMNGYIYDVSKGYEFYKTGATYHYLAGKDSSEELNMIGGDIIAKKYPIVARYK
jgi:predicted heme/steroid binding protein